MSVNISISYILYNKNIIVNLYKLHFSSSLFSLQPNKKVFHPPTFLPLQPSTHEGKPSLFYPLTFPLLQSNGPLEYNKVYIQILTFKMY